MANTKSITPVTIDREAVTAAAIGALEAAYDKYLEKYPLAWLKDAGKAARKVAGKTATKADFIPARDAAVAWVMETVVGIKASKNVMNAKFIAGAGLTDNKKGAGAPKKAKDTEEEGEIIAIIASPKGKNGAIKAEFLELVEYALAEKGEVYKAMRLLVAKMMETLEPTA